MGRKRRDITCMKPFCFYCEKAFKNEMRLHHHQKARHFSCQQCPKKFSSIECLIRHCRADHGKQINSVPNAHQGRDSIALKIFGMQGVPREDIEAWIFKNVSKTWIKLLDEKNQEARKEAQQAKIRHVQAQRIQKAAKMDEEEQPEPMENIDIPLAFSIPAQ